MNEKKPILVLCLGNEVISDDRLGYEIWNRLKDGELPDDVEVLFESAAGFGLLDLLSGRRTVLIVDIIITNKANPGTIHYFPAGLLTPSHNLNSSHQISLPTAIELGKAMKIDMPNKVDVLAVEAEDVITLKEELTPVVAESIPEVIKRVQNWIKENSQIS